jgi:hypothetical protein
MRIQVSNPQINYRPQINQTQVNQQKRIAGGCPHGNPSGNCPLCNTMGGGGGGVSSATRSKPTPKELGLLTWADLLPVWYAMQAAKFRKENDARIEQLAQMKLAIEKSQAYQIINNFIDTNVKPLMKALEKNVLVPVGRTVEAAIQKAMPVINAVFAEIKTQLVQQMAKFAGIMNEQLKQVMQKLQESMEVFKNAVTNFLSDVKQKEKAVREFLIAEAKKFKKTLLGFLEETNASLDWDEERKKVQKAFMEEYLIPNTNNTISEIDFGSLIKKETEDELIKTE